MKVWEPYAHGALLAGALALSWASWKHEEPKEKSSVTVLDVPKGALKSVAWDDGKAVATVAFSGAGDDLEAWVRAGRRKKLPAEPKADDATPAEPTPADSTPASEPGKDATPKEPTPKEATPEEDEDNARYGEPELRAFPGNDQAIKLAESFGPFVALREFGSLSPESLKEMGLDTPEGTLVITAGDKEHRFEIGDKAYGSNDNYIRSGDKVYLIASTIIGPLRGAENRLVERNPFPFEAAELASIEISDPRQSDAALQAVHTGRHDKDNAFWALAATPDQKDTVVDGLVDKLLAMRVTTYPTAAEAPEPSALEQVLTAKLVGEGEDFGAFELARKVDAAKSKPDDLVYLWYARASRTQGAWVLVSKASAQEVVDAFAGLSTRTTP